MAYKVSSQIIVSEIFDSAKSPEEALELFVQQQGFASVQAAAEREGLSVQEFADQLPIDELAI